MAGDPHNGGGFVIVQPFLEENERLFGISVKNDLPNVQGTAVDPSRVYR